MSIIKRLPWVSLALLLLTYSTWGWVISKEKPSPPVWFAAAMATLVLISCLTSSWFKIINYSNFLFKTNLRSFGVSVIAAFLLFFAVAWFSVFINTSLIIAATILARLDFQSAGFKEWQVFLILLTLTFASLALGALMYYSNPMCFLIHKCSHLDKIY